MRIMEVNLNLRIERGKKSEDYFIGKNVGEALCSTTPQADIIAMVEHMNCRNKEFLECLSRKGYRLAETMDSNSRGILIGAKGYDIETICEFSSPHFMHLKLKKETQEIDLIVMRILVGRNKNEKEFKDRREQFLKALQYIKTIPSQSIVITGDFNNAYIRDDYRGYAQQCYNNQFVVEQFRNLGLSLIPVEGYSHKGYLKEDHIILGKDLAVEMAEYDDTLFPQREDNVIGYPDHVPLVLD